MSKLPKNFEKILLGVGGVIAVTCAGLGFMKSNAVEADFNRTASTTGGKEIDIPEQEATSKAVSSLKSDRVIEQAEANSRGVDLFVGIPLFADKNNPNIPVDPMSPKMKPVHEGIPNPWWIKTGANMTFADSPSRDDDSDGFTNREEYEAKTDPIDPKSIPALIDKLAYLKDESTMWYVQFGLESSGKWAPKLTARTPDKKKVENRVSAVEMLDVGATFFKEGALANRFKFTGIDEREVTSQKTKLTQKVKVGHYEDLKPNKVGQKYESQAGLPDAELEAAAYYDRTAVLELRAIGYKGKEFKVEENTKFALPPDAPEKNYTLKKVTPEGIQVEYKDADGQTKTQDIAKGGTP
ncbi:Amuc_1099 family pilus-like system protein [Luteolibacter soli]|uniref:Amuc_1099 family pilus-like system protein n=1 Tax=Luteolibacter soli TaxID=3135280 RepID=A0ABU9B4S7_9BACT